MEKKRNEFKIKANRTVQACLKPNINDWWVHIHRESFKSNNLNPKL